MDRKDLLPGDASPSSAGMGTNAPLRDAGSMKTWKKPHAVAGMILVVTLVTPPAFPAVARFAWPPRIPWVIECTPDAMRCCHTLLRGWAHGKVQP